VGLGAAADARGQVADISIFNDKNNLVLRGRESWSLDSDVWTSMWNLWLISGGVERHRLFDDYYILIKYY